MSGLHEAFDEIVADVPVYGDLDRAIEQADRERRHRYGVVAGLAAAAAVIAVIVGVARGHPRRERHGSADLAQSDAGHAQPDAGEVAVTPRPGSTPPVTATRRTRLGCPGPLEARFGTPGSRSWPSTSTRRENTSKRPTAPRGGEFERPGDGLDLLHLRTGRVDRRPRCPESVRRRLRLPPAAPTPSEGTVSCSTERIAGPDGEPARISRYQRRCDSWDPGTRATTPAGPG